MSRNNSADPPEPIVCYVTDRRAMGANRSHDGLVERIGWTAQAGVHWVQIREKDLPARDLLHLTLEALRVIESAAAGTRVIVNDRLDVALAAKAAGVHLGRESIPASQAIRWCRGGNAPAGFLIGVSCHGVDEAREAESAGASYIFFGPVFDTPSKRSFGPPHGLGHLSEVCRRVRIPVIAIGGIAEDNVMECVRAGVAGIAAIRLFQEARGLANLRQAMMRIQRLSVK